ncbi:MAG: DNA polymerase III subunit chi [Rhodobacteraceae bacterium]|nr:DNA polymerase III subunit chi [Paracoccaceae bacterium]
MGHAMFYHLTRRPLEETLPMLIGKALQAGWRVAVRGTDRARLDWLDEKLWLISDDSFLPHGLAGGPHDADQPVLLTDGTALPNDPRYLVSIDGAEIAAGEVRAMERACILFDGSDAAALDRARAQWRALTGAGLRAEYWSEESGRWEKKRDS